jgi:hypothetical protein
MPEGTEEPAGAKFRGIAAELRRIAASLRFDLGRAAQLNALADGFDRFAERLDREGSQGSGRRAILEN